MNTDPIPIPPAPVPAFRSSMFFSADVEESVENVLDQAQEYQDKESFVRAVRAELKKWENWE